MRVLALTTVLVAAVTSCPCREAYEVFRVEFVRPKVDYETRCATFCRNAERINDHNARADSTYTAAVRWYHDLPDTSAVFAKGLKPPRGKAEPTATGPAPHSPWVVTGDSRDWWAQNQVTDVRNQEQCGDCWAESAAAVVEAAYADQTGTVAQMSVQQLAECTPQEYNRGCGGGWPADALEYVRAHGGMCLERDYPTAIGDGTDRPCNETLAYECAKRVRITDVVKVASGDEQHLFAALTRGVVSVAIDASGQGFGAYASGVYNGMFNGSADCTQTALDHAVLATGYGLERGTNIPYYSVKNSWGATTWGNLGGYILFQRGLNTCGIATNAAYVVY